MQQILVYVNILCHNVHVQRTDKHKYYGILVLVMVLVIWKQDGTEDRAPAMCFCMLRYCFIPLIFPRTSLFCAHLLWCNSCSGFLCKLYLLLYKHTKKKAKTKSHAKTKQQNDSLYHRRVTAACHRGWFTSLASENLISIY
jgi:hypothetical protein